MGAMQPMHWLIVAVVVVILFGSKKLPDAARGLGRSLRIFKSEVKEMQNDDAGPQARRSHSLLRHSCRRPTPRWSQTVQQHLLRSRPKSSRSSTHCVLAGGVKYSFTPVVC